MKNFYCMTITFFFIFFFVSSVFTQEWTFTELPPEEKNVLDEARSLREKGKYDEMKKALDYFEERPDSVYVKKVKVLMEQGTELPSEVKEGIRLYDEKKYKESLKVLSEFLKKNPNNVAALTARVITLSVAKPAEAVKECDRLLYYFPVYTQLYEAKGIAFRNLGRDEDAIKSFSDYLAFRPDSLVYGHRALTYYDLGRFEEAIKDYTEAIKLNQKISKEYLLDRGNTYCNLEDYGRAEKDFLSYINNGGKDALVYKGLALIYINFENYEKALEYANTFVNLAPESVESYYSRGGVYFYMENYKKAAEDFDMAIKLDKKFSIVYPLRAATYQKLGDYQKAIEDCENAIKYAKTSPAFYQAYKTRGSVYLEKKQKLKAISDFKKAEKYAYTESRKHEIQRLIQQAQGK